MEELSRSERVAQMKRQKNGILHRQKKASRSTLSNTGTGENRSFQIRMVLASFLFLLFLGTKELALTYENYSLQTVLDIVCDNSGMEAAKEIAAATFHTAN